MKKERGTISSSALLCVVAIGIACGVVGTAFLYADGTAYLRDDPTACANCHVMNPQFEAWQKGGHHHVATCNDCHVPHDSFIRKWLVKGENGFHHSWAFTFNDIPTTIIARESSKQIVQENCARCHGERFVHSATETGGKNSAAQCVHCHSSVGHGG